MRKYTTPLLEVYSLKSTNLLASSVPPKEVKIDSESRGSYGEQIDKHL